MAKQNSSDTSGLIVLILVALAIMTMNGKSLFDSNHQTPTPANPGVQAPTNPDVQAPTSLEGINIAPTQNRDTYKRAAFGQRWADTDRNGCDTRNDILARDLTNIGYKAGSNCVVTSGVLADPYTGVNINFTKSKASMVQIDHVVALAEAWESGAWSWDETKRTAFANDPENLLAVDGPANQAKGAKDAAGWMPANKAYTCTYAQKQVHIKQKYGLNADQAEADALAKALASC